MDFYLQERADLFRQLQQALLTLVQGPSDGHVEPLSHCLGAALVEEVRGRAVLGMDAVLQGLCQEDAAGADGAVWGQERKHKSTRTAAAKGCQILSNEPGAFCPENQDGLAWTYVLDNRRYQSDPAGGGGFRSLVVFKFLLSFKLQNGCLK